MNKHNENSLESRFDTDNINKIKTPTSKKTIIMQLDDNEVLSLTSKSKNI